MKKFSNSKKILAVILAVLICVSSLSLIGVSAALSDKKYSGASA